MKDLLKKRNVKKGIIIVTIFSLILMISGCNLVQMTPEAEKEQVVAEVGEEEYTRQEFNSYFALNEMIYTASGQPFPTEEEQRGEVKGQLLNSFVNDQLTVQLGKTEEVKVEEKDPQKNIKDFKKSYQEALGGEEEYNKILEKNNVASEEFDQYLENFFQDSEYSIALQEKVLKDVSVSEEEIKTYYEENPKQFDPSTVSAKHILADKEHKDLAEEIAQRAKDGEDFDDLMEEYKEKEGISEAAELPEFAYGKMLPEFSEAAFALEPGEVSGIVESSYGFHVIKVEEKNEQSLTPFEEVRDSIEKDLLSTAQNQEYQAYMNEKMQDIEIKTYPEKL